MSLNNNKRYLRLGLPAPEDTQDMVRIATEIKKVPDAMGAGPLVLGRDGSLPKIMGTNCDEARKLKSLFGPVNITSPGIAFCYRR